MARAHRMRSINNTYPTANISINKNRVKKHSNHGAAPGINTTIYMVTGTEFEIELDNNTQETWLAKIKFNNKLISTSGLVLRPGEHHFIERFLDENRKFLFETYEVHKGRKKAISNNGQVEIEFFKEHTYYDFNPFFKKTSPKKRSPFAPFFPDPYIPYNPSTFTTPDVPNPFITPYTPFQPFTTCEQPGITGSCTFNALKGSDSGAYIQNDTGVEIRCENTLGVPDLTLESSNPTIRFGKTDLTENDVIMLKDFMETGRVEKGSESKQEFTDVNLDFETYCTHRVEYQILPLSQKQFIETKNIRQYCTQCGRRRKKSENFCPIDGIKY